MVQTLGEARHGEQSPSRSDLLSDDTSLTQLAVRGAVGVTSWIEGRSERRDRHLRSAIGGDDTERNSGPADRERRAAGAQRTPHMAENDSRDVRHPGGVRERDREPMNGGRRIGRHTIEVSDERANVGRSRRRHESAVLHGKACTC